ncbi:heavy metal translocating P-type ATPase [Catalinimonas niigatensis]|uniref:heavy metal translocating P-type ATPase n=1 Tax=Catalinimonas niigatensis TaxID=1397264 RepID=UPI002665A703|nr:heavy metal translocating P-type ATPase metal-binding domain-containing protein [Catalinimonas niigatensis]WPP52084.1 heavy metal translocating P-type ATPase metal-binding domain-containing protein [Catalinimonas niigatensis]
MAEILVKERCYHCGEDCVDENIAFDEKTFCCQGCKTVYEILNTNDLCQYYDLGKSPGIQLKNASRLEKFAFLDHQEIISKLYDFQDGTLKKISFYIPVIHCSSCIWLLENLHKLRKGILHSSVQFLKKKVSITFKEDEITLRKLVELLASLGYEPEISLASGNPPSKKKQDRSLAIKIGIAGFCFGNSMLLSLPEYLDTDFSLTQDYQTFFGYINLLLALPVFFYAGSDYLISAWRAIRHGFINIEFPIALGILAFFGRSSYEIIMQQGPGYMDSLNGLIFFMLIGKWYQSKTYEALSYDRDYASYFPIAVTKVNHGKEESIALKDVQIGDQIMIRNQELIPADAILLKGDANIDYSFVTGESVPVSKHSGDLLYAGGRQVGSSLTIEIQKPVENSYLTELWNQEVFNKRKASQLGSLINSVSKYFTAVILLISAATAMYWYIQDSSQILNAVTSVLIIACPCALALSVPFTFGHTLRLFGKKGLYLKNTEAIEQMARTTDIVFDKTGTITQSKPQQLKLEGGTLSQLEMMWLRSAVRNSTHPLSKTIYQSLDSQLPLIKTDAFEEIPGKGIIAFVDGNKMLIGAEDFVTGQSSSDKGTTRVYLSINGEVKGYYAFENLYREGFDALMLSLKEKYKLHMLSGDNDLEKAKLAPYFDQLHFNQSPLNKLEYLKELEDQQRQTLMIGDGLNDAGALKQSKLGIAVADNIYHFSPACDAILDARQFKNLSKFLNFSHTSLKIVKAAFLFSFCYNVIGLSFAVSGMLTPLIAAILMPVSSVSVVGFITLAVNWAGRRAFQ